MRVYRPTIRDVAHLAGVSHQTVSRVINGLPLVSEETRLKVEAAIHQLGFSPNAIARSMAQGHTYILACLSPNLIDFTFATIIEGAVTEARRHGYFLLSAPTDDEDSFAAMVEQLVNSRRTDGLMVINPYIDGRFRLISHQSAVVYVGSSPRAEPFHSVTLDNKAGAKIAIRHLLEMGHRHIANVTGPLFDDSAQERVLGLNEITSEAGLDADPRWIYKGDWSASTGYQAFQYFNQFSPFPSAIFAHNDRMAIGVIRAANEAGFRVPEDLSVIGFDDIPLAAYFTPPLTTIRQNMTAIGHAAADLLISKIENPLMEPRHLQLQPELVVRASTRPL